MQNERDFIGRIAELTTALNTAELTGAGQRFSLILDTMAKDAQRWLDNEWAASNGNTTPAERAVVVLTQDLIVLLGHAAGEGVRSTNLADLAHAAVDAAQSEIIVDQAHRDYFTHPDSPLHQILADITPES